ncbi:MAG: radical SAM protein [Candidatus Helarchaeota archaeon]|nr:radical SAM protein [Candidatus Helarchaeota archaeon]
MIFTILDCFTDEPAGLGVPPYIGTYPRYIAGAILDAKHSVSYLTIDDLRFYSARITSFGNIEGKLKDIIEAEKQALRTNIKTKNLSKNCLDIQKILQKTDMLIVIAGIHTPGKYLSALPGTTKEVAGLLRAINYKGFRILTGPAAQLGSGLWGGTIARDITWDLQNFDLIIKDLEYKFEELLQNKFSADVDKEIEYAMLTKIAMRGAEIVKQYPDDPRFLIAEIETSKGCPRSPGCSFCTEPVKYSGIARRTPEDIVAEIRALNAVGIRNFRLGKQSCFYSYGPASEIEKLLRNARAYAEILHIDNVNPLAVTEDKTKLIVQYCTEGNIAAFGVESFDPEVIKANNLKAEPENIYHAIEILNKYGALQGENGMPRFLPGINILFGLNRESKKTHQENLFWLQKILDDGLLFRRINIREVVIFPGTGLYDACGDKYLKKNRKFYWKWRNEIRQKIDLPNLKRIVPIGTLLKGVRTEIYDGNTTFCRQIGTYPLIIGIKERLKLDQFIDIRVKAHMLRSVVAEVSMPKC